MEITTKMRKALGPEVAAFYSDAKGLYVGRIELPGGASGRRRREFTASTPEAFIAKARVLLRKYREAGDLPTSSPTVQTWLTYWLDNIAAKRDRPKTLAGYRSVVINQVIPAIGNVRLEKLSAAHIRMVHEHITGRGLSSTYALNAHRVLSKALKDAVREGKIHRNPAELVDAPRKARTTLQALDVAEAIEVVKRCAVAFGTEPYDPEPARWATYLLTGARRGEVLGLEWSRIGDTVDLSWQLQRIGDLSTAPVDFEYRPILNGMYWTRPKSDAGWRIIPLVDPLLFILAEHRKRVEENPWGLVFTNHGRPIDPDTESKRWPVALAAMGVTDKKVRLHDVRHTTVDLLLEAGVPEDVVMEIVGHSTRAVTRGYKDPTKIERRRRAMMQLSELVSPDDGTGRLRG